MLRKLLVSVNTRTLAYHGALPRRYRLLTVGVTLGSRALGRLIDDPEDSPVLVGFVGQRAGGRGVPQTNSVVAGAPACWTSFLAERL
jgi:hypothetical protein